MSGSADPVSIKQEPETVVTEHSQTPDTDRLTLTERDKTKDATESSTFLKTQTAAEVGLDTERDIKQERSWNETISLQADHDDAACTTEACSDTNSFSDKTCNIHLEADVKQSLTESSTARHDMESTESADMMSQYRKCQGVQL
ncbi:hypothetical protein BaRGS_00038058 [Batillaria attramentaria]|uniref:Uncharacterized protein n=1 Tax=Batillaria attramentaria TaxID=370345 RepID=A0ABD0J8B3_9CAEN